MLARRPNRHRPWQCALASEDPQFVLDPDWPQGQPSKAREGAGISDPKNWIKVFSRFEIGRMFVKELHLTSRIGGE